MTTRADWYATNNGGGWRKARKAFRCDCRPAPLNWRCVNTVGLGEQYFDTNAPNPYRGAARYTIRICKACADQELTP